MHTREVKRQLFFGGKQQNSKFKIKIPKSTGKGFAMNVKDTKEKKKKNDWLKLVTISHSSKCHNEDDWKNFIFLMKNNSSRVFSKCKTWYGNQNIFFGNETDFFFFYLLQLLNTFPMQSHSIMSENSPQRCDFVSCSVRHVLSHNIVAKSVSTFFRFPFAKNAKSNTLSTISSVSRDVHVEFRKNKWKKKRPI